MKIAMLGMLTTIGLMGCASNDQEPQKSDEVVQTQEESVGNTNNQQIPPQTDTPFAATSDRGDCDKQIIQQTGGAVGNPCLTTTEFMQQLGFNQQKIRQVMAMSEYVGRATGEAVAH